MVITASAALSQAELQQCADSVEFWWHSIDLGQGVVTKGEKTPEILAQELRSLSLPDLAGRSVLDIGAYDGFYSFATERLGAQRVVALDKYVWSIDLPRAIEQWRACKASGTVPLPVEETPLWQPEQLPGKRAFDTAHRAIGSRVEVVVGDFMTMDLVPLDTFDVTLFMGVLYHMRDPLGSLTRLASVTRNLAVIETHAVEIPGYEHLELGQFYSSNQLNADSSNWWGFNVCALVGMCRAAGFSRVELVGSPAGVQGTARRAASRIRAFVRRQPRHFRAVLHAWR